MTEAPAYDIEINVVPGRIYASDVPAYLDNIYGTLSSPGTRQVTHKLIDVRDAARSIDDKLGAHTFNDFLIMTGPHCHYVGKRRARAVWAKVRPPAK